MLAVGNYLNAGSFRGGAYGFQLEILPKVRQQAVHTEQRRMRTLTLLAVCPRSLQRAHPTLLPAIPATRPTPPSPSLPAIPISAGDLCTLRALP